MIPLTTVTAAKPAGRTSTAALYAGIFSAIIALVVSIFFPRGVAWLWIPALILTGVAPVLGYQLATGRIFSNWLSILGGLLGSLAFVVPIAGWFTMVILWPILVGLMTKGQRFARLLLWSVIGLVIALVIASAIAFLFGQDPTMWTGPAWVLGIAGWGATVGGAMVSTRSQD